MIDFHSRAQMLSEKNSDITSVHITSNCYKFSGPSYVIRICQQINYFYINRINYVWLVDKVEVSIG